MSNHPDTVQIGPYTYQICYLDKGDPRLGKDGSLAYNRRLLEIYIPNTLTPQVQATWFLAIVLEVILRNMGVDNHTDVSRELAYHLASTWGSSPNVVAFIEGGLLSRRADWLAKLDDDGFEAAMAEADELMKEADKSSFVVNDCPTEPMFPKPVDVEDVKPGSPLDEEGYRTITAKGLFGLISKSDYSSIVNSGWDSFDYAFERGRLIYKDGKFIVAPEDGTKDANARREKKIKSLQKQIKNIQNMEFK